MFNEIISILIAYCGVFVGYVLSIIAKEEVKDGRKNLALFRNILFFVLIGVFLYIAEISWLYRIIAVVAVLIIPRSLHNTAGLLVGLQPSYLISSIAFIYGFPKGSLAGKHVFRETWQFLLFAGMGFIARIFLI